MARNVHNIIKCEIMLYVNNIDNDDSMKKQMSEVMKIMKAKKNM